MSQIPLMADANLRFASPPSRKRSGMGINMNFYTVRDLRNTPKSIWEHLSSDGEVVITNNGKPTALLIDITEGGFEETVKAVRQAKAMLAFNAMRMKAAENGYMTDEEIDAEISAARRGD